MLATSVEYLYVLVMHHTASAMKRSMLARSRWRIPSSRLLRVRRCDRGHFLRRRPGERGTSAPSASPAIRIVIFTPSSSPAYAYDAGDPDPLYSNGTYYGFTTGTPAGNFIQALTSSNPTVGLAALHGRLWLERSAEPAHLGVGQHPDLSRRLLLRRPLGHVL